MVKKNSIKNKDKIKIRRHQHYLNNKERINLTNKQNYSKNKNKRSIINKINYPKNRIIILERSKKYSSNPINKEKRNIRHKQRLKNNPGFRIECNCRNRQSKILKGYVKSAHTEELLGCKIEFFKTYLFNRFYEEYPGLTLYLPACDQHHIIKCSDFDLTDPEQQKKCFHYTNVRLMPREEHKELHRREGL
jgi:hypothetical protein